jgi:hypothetical protein
VLGRSHARAQEHDHGEHDHSQHEHEHEHGNEPAPLDLFPMRSGSGTSWQPDATPMHALHFSEAGWRFMFHWNLFAGYDAQGSDRGDSKTIGIGWIMLAAQHALGTGALGLRIMLTPEPATVGIRGYPLLLQTGEEVDGVPLHDRQHPHDLFMETALVYQHPLTDGLTFQFYGGPVGEPAIGPPAFPHRASSESDPLAVLAHHWQDSTHISFGVVTAGVFTNLFQIEGSWFNGREPDQDRYNFDLRTPDSYSGRLTVNPTRETSFQASYAFLDSPEQLEPEISQQRITASAMYSRMFQNGGSIAATGVWGRVMPSSGPALNSFLAEANLDLDGHNVIFGRAEYVRKLGVDLALPAPLDAQTFPLGAFILGYVHNFGPFGPILPGLGVRGAIDVIGSDLEPFYGTRTPVGGIIFLQLQPPLALHHHHG